MATQSATKTKPKAVSAAAGSKAKSLKTSTKPAPAKPKIPAQVPPTSKAPATPNPAPAATSVKAEMKRKELVEEVSRHAELPKHKVKPVVEAMLEVMGEAVAEGRTMNLQPLGRMVHKRRKENPNANISIVRIRQSKEQS
ncbi:HU family DNA-binding protein [Roseovarius phycicola]|uniref:HU family DNA-binding protein n=1 Tax=Roseovarius phycicola TaxID=3080976 RepID=A0ABZ2HJY3_9RHOB